MDKRIAEELPGFLRGFVGWLPKGHAGESAVGEAVKCGLFQYLKEIDLSPVPRFAPRFMGATDVTMLGLDHGGGIRLAAQASAVVELERVKSLAATDAEIQLYVTYSKNSKKVGHSLFFLKKGIIHINLFD